MIFASSKGSDIAGALRYVEGPGRDRVEGRATLLGGGGFGFEPSDERTVDIAKRLMIQNGSREFQGEKDKYCTKDCLHFSLSWHPDQAPPDLEEKRETARKFLKALGMENSMHLVYDHADKKHPHIHIVASRIDPETRMAYDDYWRVKKGIQCALEKEREDELKGLRPIPEAKKQLHAERAEVLEPSREARREAIQGLYKAHKKEKQMVDDGVGGRWAEVRDLYKAWGREQRKEWREVWRAAFDRVINGKMELPSKKQVDRVGKSYGIPKNEVQHYYPKSKQKEKEQYLERYGRWPASPEEYQKHREADRVNAERAGMGERDVRLLIEQNRYEAKEAKQLEAEKVSLAPNKGNSLRQEDAKNKLLENDQISQKEFDRVTVQERKEPKRSITERIIERVPKVEKTRTIEQERGLKL